MRAVLVEHSNDDGGFDNRRRRYDNNNDGGGNRIRRRFIKLFILFSLGSNAGEHDFIYTLNIRCNSQ